MVTTTDPITPNDGPGLRARREALGLTRQQLAVHAGCSITYLANIEAGVIPKRGDALVRVLNTLDTLEAA